MISRVEFTRVPAPTFSSILKQPTTPATAVEQSLSNTGASFSSVTSTRTMAVSDRNPVPSSVAVTSKE